MIKGLLTASIWSEDLKNLLPFYRDVLGLPMTVDTPRFVVLGSPGAPAVALGSHSEVRGNATDPHRHIVGLESDDIAADVARLKAAGVSFIDEVLDSSPVSFATFRDPEGNLLQLQQRRAAT